MNLDFYSLELLARGEVQRRAVSVEGRLALQSAGERTVRRRQRGPFLMLLRWWLQITGLLIRYPADPARVAARLYAVGFPGASLPAGPSARGGVHVGR